VIVMYAYAGDVLAGVLPGPYSDEDTRRYARECLVPLELLERSELDVDRAVQALGSRPTSCALLAPSTIAPRCPPRDARYNPAPPPILRAAGQLDFAGLALAVRQLGSLL
jgi:hypothetical protein